jgi:hypothetical protein
MKAYGGVEAQLRAFLISAVDGGEWSASGPSRFTPRERAPGTHWIGGWLGPRAILDAVMKRKIPSTIKLCCPVYRDRCINQYTLPQVSFHNKTI